MNMKKWQTIDIMFCLILGTILHFTYKWSGFNPIVGIFSAVNESTWEHLKLLFYPMFLSSIIRYFIIKKKSNNYWTAQVIGILLALLFVTTFFYTYTGTIGKNFAILDISSFIIGIVLGKCVIYKILKCNIQFKAEKVSFILLIIILLCFIAFTMYPIRIPLFEDPIYGIFGLEPKRID